MRTLFIKTFTLLFFISMMGGFVAYRGGLLFADEKPKLQKKEELKPLSVEEKKRLEEILIVPSSKSGPIRLSKEDEALILRSIRSSNNHTEVMSSSKSAIIFTDKKTNKKNKQTKKPKSKKEKVEELKKHKVDLGSQRPMFSSSKALFPPSLKKDNQQEKKKETNKKLDQEVK